MFEQLDLKIDSENNVGEAAAKTALWPCPTRGVVAGGSCIVTSPHVCY